MSEKAGAGSWMGGGPHADILAAEANDDAAKVRISEECKARAKGAFSAKDMRSADQLWSKAIDLLEQLGKPEVALYSNRAMARLNLLKLEEALKDAETAIKLDKTFVKAYFRKAQALQRLERFDDAVKVYEEGKALEPSNKAWADGIEQTLKDKAKDEEKTQAAKKPAEVDLGYLQRSVEKKAKADAERAAANGSAGGEDLGTCRGYKKLADGRTTSYFHTEISDEAKALIAAQGYGKPQKLETASDAPAAADAAKGSQWNQAGTYEEKGMTTWCKTHLKEALCNVKFDVPNGLGEIHTVADLKEVSGEGQISCSRGKRRYIFDFNTSVAFEGSVNGEKAAGVLKLPEISNDCDGEYEFEVSIDSDVPPSVRPVLDSFVKSSGQGLQPLLKERLNAFVTEYKSQ